MTESKAMLFEVAAGLDEALAILRKIAEAWHTDP
jgi:hypothetical protein